MNMSAAQARIVDPILTNHVRGYRHPDRVGHLLFPSVEVTAAAGKVVEFGKESFMLYNARRAPGANTKRVEFGYVGQPYALVQDSLEGKVPREYSRDAPNGVDFGMRATNMVMNSLTLTLEQEQATLATKPDSFGANTEALSGAAQWSNAASDPIAQIEKARQVIRQACGMYPNVLICGPKPYGALKTNAKILARFNNVDIVTAKLLAELLELDEVAEGRAVTADHQGKFQDVWGDYAILAYAPKSPNGMEEPSFGYTYTMRGNPFVEQPYWDNNQKSDIYGVTYERAPVITGMLAGYLFQDVSGQ